MSYDVDSIAMRMTVDDTVNAQILMDKYLLDKMKYPVMTPDEREYFRKLMTYSMLSQGSTLVTRPVLWLPIRKKVISPSDNLFNFGELISDWMRPDALHKKDDKYYHCFRLVADECKELVLATSLWSIFRFHYQKLTGKAIAEAFTRSKEMIKKMESREFNESEMKP